MLSRQILQMVAMGLASREFAGRSTFSMSLQGLLTPCLKHASFFFLFRQSFAPFVAKLSVINQINMHTVVLETLISYCFFDNISHTVVTVCEKNKTKKQTKNKQKTNKKKRPGNLINCCLYSYFLKLIKIKVPLTLQFVFFW